MDYHIVRSFGESRAVQSTLGISSLAPIAQSVEQLPFKEKVPGSSPGGRTCEASAGRRYDDAEAGSRKISAEIYV